MYIYLDESGQSTGFTSKFSSKTFNIAIFICDAFKDIERVIRAFESKMHKKGWPRGFEIKATRIMAAPKLDVLPTTYEYKYQPMIPLREVLGKLATCRLEIEYLSINKSGLTERLKTSPFGIIYNFVAFKVLRYRVRNATHIELTVDAKNKEIHPQMHFDGYIETKAFTASKSLKSFQIKHLESHNDQKLRAADYISWAVYQKYEKNDSRFYDIIRNKMNIGKCRAWFF